MLKVVSRLIGAGLVIWLCGCSLFRPSDEIVLGEFITKSGVDDETFGVSAKNGIDLAIEETNAAGGIQGRKVTLLSVDPRGEKNKVEAAIRKFGRRDDVLAVIGEIASERSNWAARVAQSERIPMISPASTNPSVTEKGDYIFRACYIDPFQGYAMARFAHEMNFKRVGVLRNDRSNYSIGLAEYFVDRFRQLGGKIVVEESYSLVEGMLNLQAQIAAIKQAKPEALFVPVYYSDAVAISKELRKHGVRVQLLGGDGWDSKELLEMGGKDVDGVYFTNHFSAKSAEPGARAFVKKYERKFGHTPDGTAAMGYDAASIVLYSLQKLAERGVALTRDNLRIELSSIRDFNGATGPITIDENRNARKPIVILQARKGKFEYVKMVKPRLE